MKMGHTTGTKRETKNSQTWYAEIEAANIARIEAEDAARAMVTALTQHVGAAITALPASAAPRIAKAATLVQTQQVWPLTSGSFLVGSASSPQGAYLVSRGPWQCDCADATYRHATCKHILAVQLTVRMGTTYTPNYN